eukprot:SAG11_NODE_811_length_7065_cov_2.641114_1_plen_167_part_10
MPTQGTKRAAPTPAAAAAAKRAWGDGQKATALSAGAGSSKLVAAMRGADDEKKPARRGVLLRRIADPELSHGAVLGAACDGGMLPLLASWLSEAVTALRQGPTDASARRRLDETIAALAALPMTLARLQASKIGKTANKMRKLLGATDASAAARLAAVVDAWKAAAA